MRRITEVLRLAAQGLSYRQIGQPSSRSTSYLADWPVRLREELGRLMRAAIRLVLG